MTATTSTSDGYGLFGGRLPPHALVEAAQRDRLARPRDPDLLELIRLGAERKMAVDFELDEIPEELLILLEGDLMEELARDQRGAAKHERYKFDFLEFKKYAEAHELPYLPASPAAVAYFLLHDISEAAAAGYVYRVLAAVAYVHQLKMLANPCRAPLVRAARRYLMRTREALAAAKHTIMAGGQGVEPASPGHEHGRQNHEP